MPSASRDGLSLFYVQDGSGEPPLLFVHGWCCDHTFFQPQLDHFASTHAVTAPDLRGCGESDRPEEGHDIPTLADDLAWLCGELGIPKPIVVGHSFGAMIAIELAGPGGEAARRAWVEAEEVGDTALKRRIVETMCSVPLDVAEAGIRASTLWNGSAALAACKVPLLLLRSGTGGSNEPARLLPLKPDLHVGVTVGAGHFHQLEVPEQVTPMMERFIEVVVTRLSA